ncbi:hypothetical protein BGY98DRAFT_1186246 [Russula aff. rugulosa BPL654]|nr:hypothetical protein BGY98DRAFT_1186246 [Russula aff. rugulosa BPL654]
MLDRISRQFTSVDGQTSINYTPPLPYPTFHPSASDRRVNILWLISLVCSLSAALLATLVQQWARAYIRIFQQSRNPLNTARIRLFLFEGAKRLSSVAEFVPGLIHISLLLFFWGLSDTILQINTAVFVTTAVPIVVFVSLYLYCMIAPMWDPQLPYRTPFSDLIRHLVRRLHDSRCYNRFREKLVSPASMEVHQEKNVMKPTKGRMDRDVRAVQWLVEHIDDSDEMEAFVLAIPGSFNQEWGRAVWKAVVRDDQSTSPVDQPHPGLPSLHKGTTVDRLCRCVRNVFENEGEYEDTKIQRMRMRRCIETTASLVCCTNVELGCFGDITEVLSEVGDREQTNNSLTIRSNPLFTVRWTCLSLVTIWQIVSDNRLQEITKFALDRIALFQTNFGSRENVAMALTAAQKMDDYLKKAWAAVLDLRLALEPWSLNQSRTESEIRGILNSRETSIHELESIATEASDLEEIDWRIRLLQEMMDEVTHKLMRRLPGVFFDTLQPTAPSITGEAFDPPSVKTTPILPQLVFPGQQLQSLCILGRRLRDITEGQNTEFHDDTLKSLKYLREVPIPLCGLNSVMKRQLWRLLDLRDGGGLGFTIELFFLALQQFSPTSSSPELKTVLYTGTFNVITSNWKKSKNSAGTQRILVDILCDLVIEGRGIFSDFSYPPYIVEMLLDLVGNMVEGHGGSQPHINDITQELEDDNFRHRMNNDLRYKVLSAIGLPFDTAPS